MYYHPDVLIPSTRYFSHARINHRVTTPFRWQLSFTIYFWRMQLKIFQQPAHIHITTITNHLIINLTNEKKKTDKTSLKLFVRLNKFNICHRYFFFSILHKLYVRWNGSCDVNEKKKSDYKPKIVVFFQWHRKLIDFFP